MATQTDISPAPAHGAAAPFLQIMRLVKKFDDVFAVDEVSLDIQKGEIFALLGSSGCGKSTLLRMLAGFETPSSGAILLGGRDIVGLAPFERRGDRLEPQSLWLDQVNRRDQREAAEDRKKQ